MEEKELLTTKEVAAYLKINEKKVYQLIQEGGIPCTRVVGKWLFPRQQINRWLEEGTEINKSILIAGSDDPLLISLIEQFNRLYFPRYMAFHAAIGSRCGLLSLASGKSQITGVHLFHPPTGQYNLPYVEKHLAGHGVKIINLAGRSQGLMLPPGNPKGIKSIADLTDENLRFVNRNPGSGTRYLLDYLLEKEKISSSRLKGYELELTTHLATGLTILRGDADAGIGIEFIARQLRLDFIPLFEERFDLVTLEDSFVSHPIKDFFSLIEPEKLTLKSEAMPGYNFRNSGMVLT
ncbi:MAG: helix-turn-helix transcriptional regulator [Deltaproteobacteria bacterium]|nr:helix-turn-helix transcriptional regulator [Deltaproteobacteria bacterium]